MNRFFYLGKILFLGLALSQTLGTLQVYLSNGELYQKLIALQHHGYLIIPNQNILNTFSQFSSAFGGGFFFTLSIGTGLSIFSYVAAWIWDRIFSRRKMGLVVLLSAWLFCLIGVNLKGMLPLITLYFLIIPLAVFMAALRWMPQGSHRRIWANRILTLLPVLILGILWMVLINKNVFLGFRDHFLLTHPLGLKINDFYYRYSLYPAEAMKTLDQKVLKTANLQDIRNESLKTLLEKALRDHNYLHVRDRTPVDLKVLEGENILIFENNGREMLRMSPSDFLSQTGESLEEFSERSDRLNFFRQFALYSLMIGFPLVIYSLLFSLFRLVTDLFISSTMSLLIASILCFMIGMAFLFPLYIDREKEMDVKALDRAFESEQWQTRVAAFKTIEKSRMEISDFPAYPKMLHNPSPLERCWLARALSVSKKDETLKELITFLDDPSPNVVSMAFYALGRRGDPNVINEIVKRVKASDHWYTQLYAYHALMRLGWRQSASK